MRRWHVIAALVGFPYFVYLVSAGADRLLEVLTLRPGDDALLEAVFALPAFLLGTAVIVLGLLGAGIVYFAPLVRGAAKSAWPLGVTEKARCRLLNAPVVAGLGGPAAWFLVQIWATLAGLQAGIAFDRFALARSFGQCFLVAILVFVVVYHGLELANRAWFVPAFFPDGGVTRVSGTLALSLRARLLVFLLAVSALPTLLFVDVALILDHGGDNAYGRSIIVPVVVTGGAFLLASFGLTLLVARTYRVPLLEMKTAAERIGAGDFDVRVASVSTDELGFLSEAVNAMAADLRDKALMKDTFGRVVDPAVRDHLLGDRRALGGEVRECTVLFTDIRGFTSLSERTDTTALVALLNRFFEAMSRCVRAEGGVVNKFVGDSVMALFGAPLALEDHAAAAVRAAAAMIAAREHLNRDLEAEGLPGLGAGIGIHTGRLVAGTIGSTDRMEYTVIGDAVNVAARIEGLCERLGADVLLSAETAERVRGAIAVRFVATESVRGRAGAVELYTLAGSAGANRSA